MVSELTVPQIAIIPFARLVLLRAAADAVVEEEKRRREKEAAEVDAARKREDGEHASACPKDRL